MLDRILRLIKKIIPKQIFNFFAPFYHFGLSLLGAIIYGFPSKDLFVIGITGTKGKSTVTEILANILSEAEYKTARAGTIRFTIGEESRPNLYKMTMPGRFFIHKFLREAVDAGCTHAVLEITSEGSKQFRHRFLDLDAFVFTNLAPEHIESHGSFEKYLNAKTGIAKRTINSSKENTFLVLNKDDEHYKDFIISPTIKTILYSLSDAKPYDTQNGIKMQWHRTTIYSSLDGEFNIYNILAAATVAHELKIPDETIKKAIENIKEIPGRVQKIKAGSGKDIVIDYAHTPDSLEALYNAFPNRQKICVIGNTGGGRDTWKRPVMAQIADKYCDHIILTNEDPYDEDPMKIVSEMKVAISSKPVLIILDRREAISSAIKKADPGAVILISGKGTDPYIMEANGKKTPWSDYKVAKEELEKISK
jgi:UDP-N-acetylmuramoyl-L-alanyl-D-glutamate--2,6-diaminopimelate ligase